MRNVNLNLHKNAKWVICEVVKFCEKARIQVREEYYLLKRVKSLYKEWRSLQNHGIRKLTTDQKNEVEFVNKLDDVLNIVHADALNIIKKECDKQFLIAQRKKWKLDCM